jgi:hypothetical protein
MSYDRCSKCDNFFDTDGNGDYINDKAICDVCLDKMEVNMGAINIILDESRMASGEAPEVIFVEIENDKGESINIGQRESYGNLTKLRITIEDLMEANHDIT